MDKIFTGTDRAKELGFATYHDMVIEFSKRIGFPFSGKVDKKTLTAFIVGGRWAATCDCGESYYVDPDDPIGYCYGGCGNANLDGAAYTVTFPINRKEIEKALLERKVVGTPQALKRLGTQAILHGGLVHPKDAPRNWDGQTVDELRKEHMKIKEIVKEIGKVKQEATDD